MDELNDIDYFIIGILFIGLMYLLSILGIFNIAAIINNLTQ